MKKLNDVSAMFNSAEIARRIGVTPQYASLIMRGKRTGYKYRPKIQRVILKELEKIAVSNN